jgi:hypothetical protein
MILSVEFLTTEHNRTALADIRYEMNALGYKAVVEWRADGSAVVVLDEAVGLDELNTVVNSLEGKTWIERVQLLQ